MDIIFELIKNGLGTENSDTNVLSPSKVSILICNFAIMNQVQALIDTLDTELLNFDLSCLICLIFSTHSMKERKTLLPNESDKVGHWLLCHYNFQNCQTRVFDSLVRNNQSV